MLLGAAALLLSTPAVARDRAESGLATDTDIRRIVHDIDPANIERTIRKLVSFGSRNTLSTQPDPNRGIGAARDWLAGEFRKISEESGGRLKVELQGFDQPPMARVPKTTRLTNIVAKLPGEQT